LEVAEGVLWLRLPLPFALNHINLWALKDGDGWTVVDTGLATDDAMKIWPGLLSGPLGGRPVHRIIATHMHPDHVGMAGWLVERFDAPLHMTRLEYTTCRVLIADTGRQAPPEGERFYRSAGWSDGQIDAYRAGFGRYGARIHAFPASFERLVDGQALGIDGRIWRVVVGSGHSPEHACLFREDDKVLISGDQVLPRISSNVSVHPTEPAANPLHDWLCSIQKLEASLPADSLVLPSHGEPFLGLHRRLAMLRERHEQALGRIEGLLAEPRRVVDIFPALFRRTLQAGDLGLATGEALAHLNLLEHRGSAARRTDPDGTWWWGSATI